MGSFFARAKILETGLYCIREEEQPFGLQNTVTSAHMYVWIPHFLKCAILLEDTGVNFPLKERF